MRRILTLILAIAAAVAAGGCDSPGGVARWYEGASFTTTKPATINPHALDWMEGYERGFQDGSQVQRARTDAPEGKGGG